MMNYKTIIEVKNKLQKLEIAKPDEFVGCSDQEIHQIKVAQNVSALPNLYVEFLKVMGKNAGRFLEGDGAFYPELLKLKDAAIEEMLQENQTTFKLPEGAFIFLMNPQGYEFLYFETDYLSDDPPVYHYMEGDGKTRDIKPFIQWEHLSGFFDYEIAYLQEIWDRNSENSNN